MARMTTHQRAIQIYQVLIGAAHNRQILTYPMVSKLIGVPQQGLANHLDLLFRFCDQNKLPALTALVVKTGGGRPGKGFPALADLDRERESVFAHKWYCMKPLTIEALQSHSQDECL